METSLDKFLGGRIELLQPKKGFRAGTDTVMLAAAVPAQSGDYVLEFGAGSGVALCCLGARISDIEVVGVEIQEESADLARKNLALCGIAGEVYCSDIFDLPKEVRLRQFEHVMMNPPFFENTAHTAPQSVSKATAHLSHGDVAKWVQLAGKRLRPKGTLTIIHRAESLIDILSGLDEFGNVRILPITSNASAEAKTIIVQAHKQTAGKLKLLPPFLSHDDEKNETVRLKEITRYGGALTELM